MSFNLSSMGRGELCHGQCMVLLLDGRMQYIGTAKPNTRGAIAQVLGLSQGLGDWGMAKINYEV